MADDTVYLKAKRNAEVFQEDVFLKDIASVRCKDQQITAKIKSIKVHKFKKDAAKSCVISILYIIELIEQSCPSVTVQSLGEQDVLVKIVHVNKHKGWQQFLKTALVSLISFFGTAFTIMAFHNDVGIRDIFIEFYELVKGKQSDGMTILELSYSIGLGTGIILFFNHIGGKRITKDPTPIEVAMHNYETDVDNTIIETADREGKEQDV